MKEYRNKAFVLLALFLILTFESEGKPSISKGQIAEPAFNHQGDLIYIYNNTEEKISLETLKFQTKESFSLTIPLGEKSRSPIIKKDRKGQIWVVWEEWEADRSSIFLGQLKENKIIHSQLIYEAEGINICPDLSFDSNDNPWIVWINYKGRQYKVFVRESISRNIWLINFPLLSSAFNPQIITDLQDHVWVFWSGRDNKNEEIYYRVFNQYDWTPLNTINLQSNFPQINPTITLDGKGFIWLAWSGYDGKDYEIYCKFWNGKEWSKIIGITDNSKKDDSFPCISIVSDDIPIIAWTQSGGEGSQVCIKYSENNSWSEEIKISPKRGQNIFPKIVVERERIGIIWLSQNEIESELILFHQLKEKKPPDESFFKIHIIYNPSLNEDKYIGFGDSITYGYIYYEEAPEKGYIPRLEILLDQNFGDTEVVNEGWPGEITQNGLARIDKVIGNHMARYLLLMEGTNDVVFKRISMDTTAFNLEQMVKRCIDFGLFPALATIIPRNDWRWHREFFRDRIFYLNDRIRELASNLPIPLVDQFNLFYSYPEEEGGWESLLSDYNHPNEEGYQLMAEEWFEEIKNFPFPPKYVQVQRVYNEILFYRELGNYISWLDNPKIYDKNMIKGYKIYRKKINDGNDQFQLLNIIYDQLNYFDKDIRPSDQCVYVVSTLRFDQVEGPCSEPIKDH